MKLKKILLVILLFSLTLMLASFLLKNSYSYLDPDLGWHLKVGQDILKTGEAPRTNLYNFTLLSEKWIDHEWLMEVLMYVSYEKSYLFIHILFVLVALLAFFLALLPVFKKYKWKTSVFIASLAFLVFGIYSSAPHLGLRPQEFSLLFTAILLLIIYSLEKKFNWPKLLILPPFFCLWANLHGSFLLGLGLLLVWCLIKIIFSQRFFYKILSKINCHIGRHLNKKEQIILLGVFITTFLFTLINPYRLDLYSSLFEYTNTYYLSNIAEWLWQFSYPFVYSQLLFLSISLAVLVIYILESVKNRGKLNIWSLFLFLFFFILAFKSRRHFPLFVISSLALITEIVLFYGRQFIKLKPPKLLFIINSLFIILLSLLLAWQFLITANWHRDPFEYFCQRYPCQAIKYLQSRDDLADLRLFNNYGWGGYLIWTYSERLLFIDGRIPHYPYEGRSLLEEYSDFIKSDEETLRKKIEQHDIALFLLKSQERQLKFKNWEKFVFGFEDKEVVSKNNLNTYLKNFPDWQIIYEDQTAIIFKKIEYN